MADPFSKFSAQRTGDERKIQDARAKREAYTTHISNSDAEDPRLNDAQKQLGLLLADYRERNPAINRETGRDMQKLVTDFQQTCRRKGIDLPKMRLVYFVRMNHICVWPWDLEHAELQKRLHLFIQHRQRHGRTVDADDMAMGVRRAYPDYSPSRNLILPPSVTQPNIKETMQ